MKSATEIGSASHETLLAIVAEQQTVIAKQQTVITELRERIKTLEERVSLRSRPAGMPGNKWPSKRPESGGVADADAVSGVLRQIANKLIYSLSVPRVMNPSLQNENLLRDFDPDHFETFKMKLDEAADIAEAARRESDEGRSIGQWQRLFITRFPQRAD